VIKSNKLCHSWFPNQLSLSTSGLLNQETENNPADTNSLLKKQAVLVRELASFVEKTTASVRVIWQGLLHYRALQSMINLIAPPDQSLVYMVVKFSTPNQGSQKQPLLVDLPEQTHSNGTPHYTHGFWI